MKYTSEKYADYFFSAVKELLAAPSPSGYYEEVMPVVRALAEGEGVSFSLSKKGCAELTLSSGRSAAPKGVCAHVDTLGLMVRSIRADGHLSFTRVGGPVLATLDGEYCTVKTAEGKTYTGTVLSLSPAVHVYEDAATRARDEKNMYIRLDECVASAADTKALGIAPGDYVFIDPKTTVTPSGFLKSRFIDDKASVAAILTAFHIVKEEKIALPQDVKAYFTMHEEVGHGASAVDPSLSSMLAVDMGCVGADLTATERQVSICALDRGGPYDYPLTSRLKALAARENLDFAVDIYPYYGSDIGAMWRSGRDIPGALVGSGVHASHGMERTHIDGIFNTVNLILAYLTDGEGR